MQREWRHRAPCAQSLRRGVAFGAQCTDLRALRRLVNRSAPVANETRPLSLDKCTCAHAMVTTKAMPRECLTDQACGIGVVFWAGMNRRSGRVDHRVRRAIELMDYHRAAPLSIGELAQAVNLSASHFTRLFKTEVGFTPAQYDRARRLEHARQLIVETFLSIKEVMGLVGWADPSHFSRDFTAHFGESPARVRAGTSR